MPPRIAITAWKRPLPTFLGERTVLYTLGDEYVTSVADHGAVPLVLPHLGEEDVDAVLDVVDGLVLSGGGDVHPASYGRPEEASKDVSPAADASELALARGARARGLPTLAVCRGMQIVNVAFGGTLRQDVGVPGTVHPPISDDPDEAVAARHPVEVRPGSTLADVLGAGTRSVNNIHHQAIERTAPGFTVTATAPDGVVEAIEPDTAEWPLLAVQWHPEKLGDADAALFAWLRRAADRRPVAG